MTGVISTSERADYQNTRPRTALPKLVYIGDVPVEASYHGSALLYRLFQRYPASRLHIVEANLQLSRPERRLTSVPYQVLSVGRQRWLNTRFHAWVAAWFTLKASALARQVPSVVGNFAPEAVLTVAHGFSWITAAMFARQLGLPLHFIVHDDWPRAAHLPACMKGWLNRRFGDVYRQATSRLCVSPFMVQEYEQRYGASGTLLYPSRAADAPAFAAPPERIADTGRPLVFAFGGTINTGGQGRALHQLSESLERIGGHLHLYGPISDPDAERAGLLRANVRLCGLVPAPEFISRMRAEVDVLFAPMSFASKDRTNMEISFPSKLTDYTAAGIPLLIYGPPYCSAVRWARQVAGVAEVVDSERPEDLVNAVRFLAASPEHRVQLGRQALRAGAQYFACDAVEQIFYNALREDSSV
jgi:glycosyltransferase involved in cell wall biosynthesis